MTEQKNTTNIIWNVFVLTNGVSLKHCAVSNTKAGRLESGHDCFANLDYSRTRTYIQPVLCNEDRCS